MVARLFNNCYRRKATIIAYPECIIVASGIQHAMRMCHIVIRGLFASTKCFYFILLKTIFWRKKVIEQITFVLIFFITFSETFLFSFQEELREIDQKVYWFPRKAPIILVRFY
jgi:hypothetical protein